MNLESVLERWLREQAHLQPQRHPQPIAIAVSGGRDSSALAVGLARAAVDTGLEPRHLFVLAHYVHGIRSANEREADLAQVRKLSRRTDIPLVVGEADAGTIASAAARAGGLESAAREARYAFLRSACRAAGASTLCTAHHADDQAETVLMRLLRGVEGTLLSGIPAERDLDDGVRLARPLLSVGREEIAAYVTDRGVPWVEDRTNVERAHRRNLVRHEVLPALQARWPALRRDLCTLATAMGSHRSRVEQKAAAIGCTMSEESAVIQREAFFCAEPEVRLEVLYRVLEELGALSRTDRPAHRFFGPLLGPDPGGARRLIGSRGIRVEAAGEQLRVLASIVRGSESGYLREVVPERPVDIGEGWTIMLTAKSDVSGGLSVIHLNRIKRPVVVRSRRAGDRVTGAGTSGGERSVSSALASMSVPRERRHRVPLVVDRNGVVVVLGSVFGYRDIVRETGECEPGNRENGEYSLVVRSTPE